MLNISDYTKQQFLTDSTPKQMYIEVEDVPGNVEGVNWYYYNLETERDLSIDYIILSCREEELYADFLDQAEYFYVSCNMKITSYTKLPNTMRLAVARSGSYVYSEVDLTASWVLNALTNTYSTGLRLFVRIPKESATYWINAKYPTYPQVSIVHSGEMQDVKYTLNDIQVQSSNKLYTFNELYPELLRTEIQNPTRYGLNYLGTCPISRRADIYKYITLPQPHIDPLTNEDLEMESFSFTESICSADNLQLGCCEASHCEFTIVNKDIRLNNRYIKPYIVASDITPYKPFDYSDINWFKGFENLKPGGTKHWRWPDTKASSTFYFNLKDSVNLDYLHCGKSYIAVQYKIRFTKLENLPADSKVRIGARLKLKSGDYSYYTYSYNISDVLNTWIKIPYVFFNINNDIESVQGLCYWFRDVDNKQLPSTLIVNTEADFSNLDVRLIDNLNYKFPEYTTDDCLEWKGVDIDAYIDKREKEELIPYGRFKVTSVEKSHTSNILKLSVTAEDDISKLNNNASNWYSLYMYGVNTNQWNYNGIEYARQLYSSLWNFFVSNKMDSRENHAEELVASVVHPEEVPISEMVIQWDLTWEHGYYDYLNKQQYCKVHISNVEELKGGVPLAVDVNYRYRLDGNFPAWAAAGIPVYWAYKNYIDEYGRGSIDIADVLVREKFEGIDGYGNPNYNKFCVNNGDYFVISDECIELDIFVPLSFLPHAGTEFYTILNTSGNSLTPCIEIYKATDFRVNLTNASRRLMYYNYRTREISSNDTSITGLDVVRSLLELTGCFFNINRFGEIEYKYPDTSGLYPSNDLFPADDLYPSGTSQLIAMGYYITAECADYSVQNFGRIQILSNETEGSENSCQYEYVGNPKLFNAYVISNNILYSNSTMLYTDDIKDVNDVLIALYERIKSFMYTPNTTQCVGMPWIEAGDRINVLTSTGGFESFIFRRTLKGIHGLRDTFEASGDEYTNLIEDYGYKAY